MIGIGYRTLPRTRRTERAEDFFHRVLPTGCAIDDLIGRNIRFIIDHNTV